MADGEGFEPPRGVNLCRFSRPVLLTTQPPVRMAGSITYSAAICYPQSKDQCSRVPASSRIASAREFRDPMSEKGHETNRKLRRLARERRAAVPRSKPTTSTIIARIRVGGPMLRKLMASPCFIRFGARQCEHECVVRTRADRCAHKNQSPLPPRVRCRHQAGARLPDRSAARRRNRRRDLRRRRSPDRGQR